MSKHRMPNRALMGTGLYWESMSQWERGLLEWALDIGKGNYEFTARILGTTKGHVYNRCRTLEIDVSRFVPPKKQPILAPEPEPVVVADATETEEEAPEDAVPDDEDGDDEGDGEDPEETEEPVEDETEPGEDDLATEDEEDADELCICGKRLTTEDELQKWLECTECRQKRLAKRLSEKTVVPTTTKKENGA